MYIYQPNRILLDEQIKKYSHHIKGRVLDVGAGSSDRYGRFFDVQEYLKMDLQPGKNIDVVGQAEHIPFEAGAFDSLVCTQVLGDIRNPSEALKEFYRVLKPGGMVLLTESFINEMHDEPRDFWRFTRFGLEHLFQEVGFKIITIDQRGGFFTAGAQNNIRYLINKFNLYSHNWSRVLSPFFRIYSKTAFFLDKLDQSETNRKFAIGWCVLAQK